MSECFIYMYVNASALRSQKVLVLAPEAAVRVVVRQGVGAGNETHLYIYKCMKERVCACTYMVPAIGAGTWAES